MMRKLPKTVILVALPGVAIAFAAAPSLNRTFARETESRIRLNHDPGSTDLAQTPMPPRQTPMPPGQTPITPGQMPMGQGQMPYQGMPMSGEMLGLMCETHQIMSTLTPEQMQEIQPIMLEHQDRMVEEMQTTVEQLREMTNQPES